MTEKDYEDQIEEGAVFEDQDGVTLTVKSVEHGMVEFEEDYVFDTKVGLVAARIGDGLELVEPGTPSVDQMMEELREEWGVVYVEGFPDTDFSYYVVSAYEPPHSGVREEGGETFTEALEAAYREHVQEEQ